MTVEVVVHARKGMRTYFMALMSYLGVLVFVPLLMNREDEYVYFHAKQGLMIWILGILAIFMLYVPVIGKLFFSTLATLVMFYSLIGLVSVMLHKAWKLPLIYNLASKL